jgi:hypothetical protein
LDSDWGKQKMRKIQKWLATVYLHQGGRPVNNPIGECDHYNNPDKERRPHWMDNVDFVIQIGNHHFYRTKPQHR